MRGFLEVKILLSFTKQNFRKIRRDTPGVMAPIFFSHSGNTDAAKFCILLRILTPVNTKSFE